MWLTVDPWRELERMRKDLDSLFTTGVSGARYSFPLVNMYEDKDTVTVQAELPGMTKDDVAINYSGGILTLSGSRKPAVESEKLICIRSERSVGEFEKNIQLPTKIEADNISATFINGVLTVTLPKAEEAKPKQIKIQVQ